jgi:hypothetical protein
MVKFRQGLAGRRLNCRWTLHDFLFTTFANSEMGPTLQREEGSDYYFLPAELQLAFASTVIPASESLVV